MPSENLVIIGDSAFAEISYEYFTHDSLYKVVGFAVERQYRKKENLFGLPVVDYERLEDYFPPATHSAYAAITYSGFNRLRTRFLQDLESRGYSLASYVSSRAFVWRNAILGKHVFIFEDNTIQPYVVIGDNVVLWSGNHVGHHSNINNNVFISSHVVISGYCNIGENCFLGVNSTIGNNVTVGADCWISPGVSLVKDSPPNTLYKAAEPEIAKVSAKRFFKVRE